MSNLGNKEIMSRNLSRYIEEIGKDRKDIAKDLNVPYSTFTDWVNGKTYPRIDKIEKMAEYFGVTKSHLVEDRYEILKRIKKEYAEVVKLGEKDELENGYRDTRIAILNRISDKENFDMLDKTGRDVIGEIISQLIKLNKAGQQEAVKRVEELTYIEKYTTKNTFKIKEPKFTTYDKVAEKQSKYSAEDHLTLKAAHRIEGASEEDQQHDEDIMSDPDF